MVDVEPLPPWRPLLRAARQREGRAPQGLWLQLASVAADGTPRVRTLVFRGWAAPDRLDLFSDGRSAKAAELLHQPAVELCWLLPQARCQFRLRGVVIPLAGQSQERASQWRALAPAARALWGWPAPGTPLDLQSSFPAELPSTAPVPEHFLVLRVALEQVELLELSGVPHHRRRWCAVTGWQEESLHP
jgi:pyridoxamine 5'-phosphate oxidase